jgi:hypothetical protein
MSAAIGIRVLGVLALAVLAAPAPRVAGASGPALTIYTRDLGFVRETRTVEIAGARDTLRIADVPERLDFSSITLDLGGAARVMRLAYRYDVATGDGMLERARGGRVRATLRGDRVVEGTLIAADGSWLTVREDDGAVHTLSRASLDDVRLANPGGAFSLRPTLEAALEGGRKGRAEAKLSYLTGGLSWSAEHTLVRRGETGATWSAAVTVENTTGRDFVDADLKLVAGEPSIESPAPQPMMVRTAMALEAKADQGGADLSEQGFSEYHLYTLGRPATLRDRETQKLTMLEPRSITVHPRYLYRGGDPRGVRTQLEVVNDKASGLGVPLPAGRVRVFEADPDGDMQFTGEARIAHTPEGEKLTLDVGQAFDLAAERRELYNKRISDREREYSVEIKLRNRKKSAVEIVAQEGVGGDVEVIQKSHEFTRKDANTIEFKVPVPVGKEVVITYTVRVRY